MFTEIFATSNFSFLRGASSPEELIQQAHSLCYSALAITDRNSLAGVVRAHGALRAIQEREQSDLQLLIGAAVEILPENESTKLVPPELRWLLAFHPTDLESYGALSELLSVGKNRSQEGDCLLTLKDIAQFESKCCITAIPPDPHPRILHKLHDIFGAFEAFLLSLQEAIPQCPLFSLALITSYGHLSNIYHERVVALSNRLTIPLIASNAPHYHTRMRKPLHDVVTCIREHTTVQEAGYLLAANGERYLKASTEMKRLYREHPEALERAETLRKLASHFSLDQLRYEYPHEICETGEDPLSYLTRLTWDGARERYQHGIPPTVATLIKEELQLIHELEYEKYFLTCYDIVKFARSRHILCQGRGAAANSAVCYCLGITSVDPSKIDILFARFVSKERNEPPDIDIDFEHERREEVIQYIYEKYGRERAALTCEVVTYRHRSAVREVGKALGLPLQTVDQLAKSIHRWTKCTIPEEDLREYGLDPNSRPIQNTLHLTNQLLGFPRHLSQHVGGFIISEKPLTRIVPIRHATMEKRTIIEWDKDDIEELGMLKIDILALGMLTCIRKALELINHKRVHEGKEELKLHSIPAEDPRVYEMVGRADTIGVFQIESRAQMSMLPRLKPRCFYDLIIEIAIVRPGPIRGNMVHPYLRRRQGKESIRFPDKRVEEVLGKTLGVPIFQEQAMRLAIELAGFSPGEAEQLRRAMAAWRRKESVVAQFVARITEGMLAKGYTLEFINQCCQQLKGFSEYGFPESHAASFALLVYASAWIKCYYPAVFAVALINSQPMGFYAPAQILEDVKKHGVSSAPIDVNYSGWDLGIESLSGKDERIRLGMRLVRGLQESDGRTFQQAVRSYGKCSSIQDLWKKVKLVDKRFQKASLIALAHADGYGSLGLTRREALWDIRALPDEPLPLDVQRKRGGSQISLPGMSKEEATFRDYEATHLSLRAHPIQFIRRELDARRITSAKALQQISNGISVGTAGIMLFRQRPGTANGVVFITLEDETGMTNLIIPPQFFTQHRRTILASSALAAYGKLEKIGPVIYVVAEKIESLDRQILSLRESPFIMRSYSY
ncbi:MAG: error-prone DNA polymerase [Bdellovibrionales bacterium]|nr:error-prone DNA polymerase [Bdellovibrionales bacterium]